MKKRPNDGLNNSSRHEKNCRFEVAKRRFGVLMLIRTIEDNHHRSTRFTIAISAFDLAVRLAFKTHEVSVNETKLVAIAQFPVDLYYEMILYEFNL